MFVTKKIILLSLGVATAGGAGALVAHWNKDNKALEEIKESERISLSKEEATLKLKDSKIYKGTLEKSVAKDDGKFNNFAEFFADIAVERSKIPSNTSNAFIV